MKINSAVNRIILGLLFAYPILLLTVKGGMSATLILLVAVSLYLLIGAKSNGIRGDIDRDMAMFSLAMGTTFLSILLSQLYHSDYHARAFDSASRFLFSIPIFLMMRNVDTKVIGVLQYGIPSGAILAAAVIALTGQKIFAHSYFSYYIHYGDLALMLGVLSAFSINWTQKDDRWLVLFKLAGLAAGLYVSLVSGARGGWAAIPMFPLIWILTTPNFRQGAIIKLCATAALVALAATVAYFSIDTVQFRVDAAMSDLTAANQDTSLGIRFQLWKAAMDLFMQNPVLGVGAEGFADAMNGLSDSGTVSKVAAQIGKGEVHSYYFAVLTRFGLVGIASVLLLFIIPVKMFSRTLRSSQDFYRISARMGLALVLGFAVFCLTVEMFNLKFIASFYAVTLAILMAAVTNRAAREAPHQRMDSEQAVLSNG